MHDAEPLGPRMSRASLRVVIEVDVLTIHSVDVGKVNDRTHEMKIARRIVQILEVLLRVVHVRPVRIAVDDRVDDRRRARRRVLRVEVEETRDKVLEEFVVDDRPTGQIPVFGKRIT